MEGHDRQRYKAWHRMMMMTLEPHKGQLSWPFWATSPQNFLILN